MPLPSEVNITAEGASEPRRLPGHQRRQPVRFHAEGVVAAEAALPARRNAIPFRRLEVSA
jgi:hypothetical protein